MRRIHHMNRTFYNKKRGGGGGGMEYHVYTLQCIISQLPEHHSVHSFMKHKVTTISLKPHPHLLQHARNHPFGVLAFVPIRSNLEVAFWQVILAIPAFS